MLWLENEFAAMQKDVGLILPKGCGPDTALQFQIIRVERYGFDAIEIAVPERDRPPAFPGIGVLQPRKPVHALVMEEASSLFEDAQLMLIGFCNKR